MSGRRWASTLAATSASTSAAASTPSATRTSAPHAHHHRRRAGGARGGRLRCSARMPRPRRGHLARKGPLLPVCGEEDILCSLGVDGALRHGSHAHRRLARSPTTTAATARAAQREVGGILGARGGGGLRHLNRRGSLGQPGATLWSGSGGGLVGLAVPIAQHVPRRGAEPLEGTGESAVLLDLTQAMDSVGAEHGV